jgi:hypothetical protein
MLHARLQTYRTLDKHLLSMPSEAQIAYNMRLGRRPWEFGFLGEGAQRGNERP